MVGQMMTPAQRLIVAAAVAALALAAPWFAYPVFLMTALCFALFACAFNLLLGYDGLMSCVHAMFFGMAGYYYGHVVKAWDMPPELGLLDGRLDNRQGPVGLQLGGAVGRLPLDAVVEPHA